MPLFTLMPTAGFDREKVKLKRDKCFNWLKYLAFANFTKKIYNYVNTLLGILPGSWKGLCK